MSREDGARAAISGELHQVAASIAASAPEQVELPLIGVPSDLAPERVARAQASATAARAGRPPGAQNKATREVRELCRRMFGWDPMVEGFRWAQHTPESLSLVLGCSKLEAWDRLEALRRDLARYLYAPMAPVGADGAPAPSFVLQVGPNAVGMVGGAGDPPWLRDPRRIEAMKQIEQNQGVSGAAPAPVSHAPVSHED